MSPLRYDLARFSPRTHLTSAGFLRAPAFFTRVGVFTYTRADGSKVRELRPREEVFHEDSLATLRGAPVVELHPKDGMVSPQNAKQLTIGWSSDQIERADTLVKGEVTVMDAVAIEKVRNKELSEISLGYQCSIDQTPGNHPQHGRYDQIQRDIRYNHVALGPRDWGRAGGDVSIRLDSVSIAEDTDLGVSSDREPVLIKKDSKNKGRSMETTKITIGGVEYEVPTQAAQAFRQAQERADAEASKLKSALEALQGRFDAQEATLKKTQEDLTTASDPKRFDSAVKDRVDLEQKARKILGEGVQLPSGTREIQEMVLKHDHADLDLEGKSDDYVAARFDHMIETPRPAPKPGAPRADALKAMADPNRPDSVKARQDMIERSAQAWQQPLLTSTRS